MFRLLQGHQHGGTYKGIQVGQMFVCSFKTQYCIC